MKRQEPTRARIAPLALLCAFFACVEARPPPAAAPAPATATSTPLFLADESMHFGSRETQAIRAFAVDDVGTLYVATGGSVSGELQAIDETLRPRWKTPFSFQPQAILAIGGGRVAVFGAYSGKDASIAIVGPGGAVGATTKLSALLGEPCTVGRRWPLARDPSSPGGVSLLLQCATRRVRARLSPELHLVALEPWDDMRDDFAADGARWRVAGDERAVYAQRFQEGAAPISQPLVKGPQVLDSDLLPVHLLTLSQGDVVVANNAAYPLPSPTGTPTPRFAGRSTLTRIGPGRGWTTELAATELTAAPPRAVALSAATDGALLVALDHVGQARVGNVTLPVVDSPTDLFPALGRQLAIMEVDPATGNVRAITILRPRAPTAVLRGWPEILATAKNYFVHYDDDEVAVYPRTGQRIDPSTDLPATPPAPLTLAAVGPSESPAATVLGEAWSEVCGARWKTKGNAPCRLAHVAVGTDGTVAAGGGYYEESQLGARRLPHGGMETGIVAVYEHDGRPRFQKLFRGAWLNAVEQVLVRDDGRIVVVGYHGQGFSLDGRTLPHRDVPKVGVDDADFHAQTPFLAIFDAKGKLELLEDLDALVHHSPSTSYHRVCSATLAQGTQANETWVLSRCGMSEAPLPEGDPERGTFRFLVRGTEVGPATRVGPIEHATNADAWELAADGRLFAVWANRDRAYLVGVADGHALVGPLVEAQASAHGITRARQLVPTKSGVWAAVMLEEGAMSKDAIDRIVVASAGSDLATPVARVLATMSTGGSLDGLAVDDEGRPIVSLGYRTPMVLAGQSFVPSALAPDAEPSGRVFVRLTKDGARIDRVFVPQPKPGGCSLVGLGSVTSMAVRANVLALTYRFGVKGSCSIEDEPSTVMAFTLPP